VKIPAVRRLPASKRTDVTREEYNELVDILNRRGEIVEEIQRELKTQFKRMAQIQTELDEVRRAWVKTKSE
jgi:hypothetical protein